MVQGTWSKATAVVTRIKVTVFKIMLFPAQANWALPADPFNQGRCFCGYLLGFERILVHHHHSHCITWRVLQCILCSMASWGLLRVSFLLSRERRNSCHSVRQDGYIGFYQQKENCSLLCRTVALTCLPCSNPHSFHLAQLEAGPFNAFSFPLCHHQVSCCFLLAF